MEYQCLIIDDELEIAETTAEYFNMFDITTAYETNYQDGMEFLNKNQVSLLLLDINLGKSSGFEFCRELRRYSSIPVFFISARTSDDDVLTALNIGGDDYIKKPYTLNILLAKVKAVLKRIEMGKKGERAETAIMLDHNFRQAVIGERRIKLKEMEFKLLSYLIEHKDRTVSKEELFEQVWKDHFVGDGTLSVHIRHLREKIEKEPEHPAFIRTVWGIGYIYTESQQEEKDRKE